MQAATGFDNHHHISQPANLVLLSPAGEYEENNTNNTGGWFQESDYQFSNIFMRIRIEPEEETALVELSHGPKPTVFDLYEDSNADVEESDGPGDDWLEETISQHLKTRRYHTTPGVKQAEREEAEICVVCLSEYENEEILATLAVFWNSVIRYFFVYRIEFGLNSNSVVSLQEKCPIMTYL